MILKRIIFSLSVLPIWTFSLLDNRFSNSTTVFLGLFYTALAPYFYKQLSGDQDRQDKWQALIFIGPLFFFVSTIILAEINSTLFFHPIFYAFAAFFIGYKTDFSTKTAAKVFFCLGACLFYTFSLYNYSTP